VTPKNADVIVVTGAAGSFGRVLVPVLLELGKTVHAVDRRSWPECPKGALFHHADVLKRGFENVVRSVRPGALVHLAMIHRFGGSRRERQLVNFEGTARVIDIALANEVGKIVVASRATVYGAFPEQEQFLTEERPPAAGRMFADMQDLVSADLYASGMLWRYPERALVVLRLVNVLGPHMDTLLQRYLRRRRVFTIAGFDPLYQVMHESDMARAIVAALAPGLRGIFNVTGPGEVPLHVLIEKSGASRFPLPERLARFAMGKIGFPHIPEGALAFLKYPCTVDGARFREATGFQPAVDLRATLASVAEARLSAVRST